MPSRSANGVRSGRAIYKLDDWALGAAVSPSTLRMWCRANGLHARAVVRFVRGLSAIYRSHDEAEDPTTLLDFADRRSTELFLRLSGPLATQGSVLGMDQFCAQQRFVSHRRIIRDVVRLMADQS